MSEEIKLFEILNESAENIQHELDISYLEALIETMENILHEQVMSEDIEIKNEKTLLQLKQLYQKVPKNLEPELLRRSVQIAILKAIKNDSIQSNYQMTPDSIGFLVSYLIEIIAKPSKNIHLADLTVGTGNLLFTVHHYLKMNQQRSIKLTGVDNDELMLALSATSAAFQKTKIHLMLQDALRPVLMEPADLIVSDLPVGYYPDDLQAKKFKTSFKKGHSYSHYLLVEQQLNYLKEAGFAFFILPTHMFNDPQVGALLEVLKNQSYIQGIIELPHNLFMNENSRKSVLIVQKHGKNAKQLKTLVTSVPEFKEVDQMERFLQEIKKWEGSKE